MTQTSARAGRITVLVAAFLGWLFAGSVMSMAPLAGRVAIRSFGIADEGEVGQWFSYLIVAFLLGAATGGLVFGWIGDRIGRAKAMGFSILVYSLVSLATLLVTGPTQLLVVRFVACMGVGGMWPNGVALVSEVWPNASRPLLAGLIGTSANIGFMIVSFLGIHQEISTESWRWVFALGGVTAVLGLLVLVIVPESALWRERRDGAARRRSPAIEVFRPPLLRYTLVGIGLGAVPLMGGWGAANWMPSWADNVAGHFDPTLKAWTQWSKSFGAAVGALLGGWLASRFGRRTTYFGISVLSLGTSFYIFSALEPTMPSFLYWVFTFGLFGTIYFGWLPLYLPELFPTRVRATGTGVAFNWGRILTTFGVLGTGKLVDEFNGDYARAGQVTCFVFVIGMILICFAPDTSGRRLEEDGEAETT